MEGDAIGFSILTNASNLADASSGLESSEISFDFSELDSLMMDELESEELVSFSPSYQALASVQADTPLAKYKNIIKNLNKLSKKGRLELPKWAIDAKAEAKEKVSPIPIGSLLWLWNCHTEIAKQLHDHIIDLNIINAERVSSGDKGIYRTQKRALKFYIKTLKNLESQTQADASAELNAKVIAQRWRVWAQWRNIHTLDWIECGRLKGKPETYKAVEKSKSNWRRVIAQPIGLAKPKGKARMESNGVSKPIMYR